MLNANGYKYLRLSFDGFIGIIKMNRPPVNAFNLEFIDEFNNAIDEFAINSGVRVVVITSNVDKFFATGVDIKLMFTMDPKDVQSGLTNLFDKIQHLHKPVIAMINGHALGGGCELTLCCDFRFMEKDSSKIGLPEINLGIIPAAGGTQRLCRLLGRGRAMELLVLGIPLMAKEALEAGLIHKAFDHKDLMERTLEYAHKLANQAPVAVALIKKCINEGIDADLKRGLEIEREALLTALQTEDAREGIRAFLEKRSLKFKGK
jgi:enoyl-CoA hydratase/carnithine racemase